MSARKNRGIDKINKFTVMPRARNKEIVVQTIENETLVYDLSNHKASSLNKTVSCVWQKCDGKTLLKDVVEDLEKQLKTNLDEEFVLITLSELEKVGLLEKQEKKEFPKFNRRHLLGRYAIPALSLPIILSLVAPTSAQMGSCLATGQTGCNLTPCCPNNTCQAIVGPGGIITNQCVATP